MTESNSKHQFRDRAHDRRDRAFAVSVNRGDASHKIRYVESGGAAVDVQECTFCQSVPDLSTDH